MPTINSAKSKKTVITPNATEYDPTGVQTNESKSTSGMSDNTQSQNVSKCYCCGTILTFPNKAKNSDVLYVILPCYWGLCQVPTAQIFH